MKLKRKKQKWHFLWLTLPSTH